MANYLITLRYPGKLNFPDNHEAAKIEAYQILLNELQHGAFELLRVDPWISSDQSATLALDSMPAGDQAILEVKLRLTDQEVRFPEKIMQKITQRMQRAHFHIERLETSHDGFVRSVITLSELQRHRRYIVHFHYPLIPESVSADGADKDIVNEICMLLQCGEMALGTYRLFDTDAAESGHQCGANEIRANQTIVEVNVMVNEFNIDFEDSESIYYYVLGQIEACGCRLSYKYNCVNGEDIETHIGVEVYCTYSALERNDYDDLIQQL